MKFTHLHVHSHYSLLDGLAKIDGLIKQVKAFGMESVALTDHGNMYAAIEFYKKAKAADIKPILGVEAYIAQGSMHSKQPGIDDKRYHLTLLAENATGYKNLVRLVTKANLEGFYYKPRLDKATLKEFHDGIIALSGCLGGEVARAITAKRLDDAERLIYEYQDVFGKNNFYLELGVLTDLPEQKTVNDALRILSKKTGAKVVATGDIHYIHKDDRDAQDILVSVQTGSQIQDDNRFTMKDMDLSVRSPEQMIELFKDCPEAISNTQEISDRVNIELDLGKWTFPNFQIPENTTYNSELERLTYEGIEKRKLERTEEVEKRIAYELDVIQTRGYSPYFLVVADLLHYAHEHGILTTIRGSVAGSLVTYLTGITNINPLEYKLPFERFLNKERPQPPDIDMDYADNRRDEVIHYAKEKYGEHNVAQIGTFGTMMARAAVRDVARALGYPYALGDKIAKFIPLGSQGFPMTIEQALTLSPELLELHNTDEDAKRVITQAKKLEGCVRHISVHAAGVVISAKPLWEYTPLQLDPKGGKIITQYDMHAIEDAGLLKFDFLGIRNLAILGDAIRLVKQYRDITIDIQNIPLDDKKTFELLAQGETMGLFQLNGSGMTKYLKELRPSTIHDINAMVALYRPGPIESIPMYIERKHNPRFVSYLDPRMEEILDQSYGVITYQDDVMLIAIKLAGYSWLEADKLRKAMGKKIPKEMAAQKDKLIKGLVSHGMSEEKALTVWQLIEPFAAYGFNKAHAASYGFVAYQTAYMKANYPGEYMTAVLTAESGDTEEIAKIIAECIRMKIPVLPPNINESIGNFAVIKNKEGGNDTIRFGLSAIKNVGANIIEAIVEERSAHGSFKNVEDVLRRIHHKDLNKKSLESLIKVGAFDNFEKRSILLESIDNLLAYSSEMKKETNSPQVSLFSTAYVPKLQLKDAQPLPKAQELAFERELLGLYISGHPLDAHKARLEKSNFKTLQNVENEIEGSSVKNAGIISTIKKILTKKGETMLFVEIEDHTAKRELIVFPKLLAKTKDVWQKDNILMFLAKVDRRSGELKLLCEDAKILTS